MEATDTYKTLESTAEGLFKDKGSKFIAFAYPISTEDEAKKLVQAIKKEHFSARHHCYAYRLGANGESYRSNDDGEPSGTAGKPILGQLLSHELTNTLVVVVRYFGGTLLGTSGLINAYKNATSDAIQKASIVTKIVELTFRLEFEYPIQNSVMKIIKDEDLMITQSQFSTNCIIDVAIRKNKCDRVAKKLDSIEGVKVSEIS